MSDVTITVKINGPYRVEGPIKLIDAQGKEWDLTGKPAISLCRCGQSSKKPFCDGTHNTCGFQSDVCAP
ncbi:MAG: CDGSH iron-sulfur domain-containing protein [Acidobacteriales bacterium]|nr:CDGSH iron-sulfur domain-containing protein [Terriglobales bacterium]